MVVVLVTILLTGGAFALGLCHGGQQIATGLLFQTPNDSNIVFGTYEKHGDLSPGYDIFNLFYSHYS